MDDLAVQWCKHLPIEYGDVVVAVVAAGDAAAVVDDVAVEAVADVVAAAAAVVVVVDFAAADVAVVVEVDRQVVSATRPSSVFASFVLCCCGPSHCCSCVGDDPEKNKRILFH